MKLYTRPRPLVAGLLRPGDQVACGAREEFIGTEQEYIELSLADGGDAVRWTVVISADLDDTDDRDFVVAHSRGIETANTMTPVIIREVIELDPWSYVQGAQQ